MKRKARRKALIGSCIFSTGTAGYYLMGIYNQNKNEENTTMRPKKYCRNEFVKNKFFFDFPTLLVK